MNHEILEIWVTRAKRGDRRAADCVACHLLSKFRPAIKNAARRIGIQESHSFAGLAVAEALKQVQIGDSVEAFFFSEFNSHVLSELRAAARRTRLQNSVSQIGVEYTIDMEEEFAIRSRFENAALSERDRQIILARLRGETFTQLSKRLQISVTAVSNIAARAFKKIEAANELA